MKVGLLVLCAMSLQAQVSVSFAPGEKLPRGVQHWTVTACSAESVTFDAGWAYQSAQRSGIPALQLVELARMTGKKSKLAMAILGLQFTAELAAYLAANGTIAAKPRLISELLLVSGVAAEAGSLLKSLPAEYVVNALQGPVMIPAGGCVVREMFARKYKSPPGALIKNPSAILATIELPRRNP